MLTHSNIIHAAVVQAAPVAFQRERTVEKVRVLTNDAAHLGAKLVVFPEAFISAYPRGLSFGAVVGSRTPAGREEYRRYWESAVDVPGPTVATLSEIAAQNQVYLVIGVIERDGGTLYCTVLFFTPDGSYLGKHRKLMPTAAERLVWGCGDGSTLPVFETEIGRLGAVICWENDMPLLRMAMYVKGIQLYCAPTADGRDTWIATMQHIALEGRCARPLLQSVCPPFRLSRKLCYSLWRRARDDSVAWRQLHHQPAGSDHCRAKLYGRVHLDGRPGYG